jgi:death on curing protein
MTDEIVWILSEMVPAIHRRQISEHGGSEGIRDEGLLASALARPKNLYAYGENVDMAALAASYALGVAKNHPFIDGNKRTALVVMRTFLAVNDVEFVATQEEKYLMILGLAEGTIEEEELAEWIRSKST